MSKSNVYSRLTGIFSSTQSAKNSVIKHSNKHPKPTVPTTTHPDPKQPNTLNQKPKLKPQKSTILSTQLDPNRPKTLNQNVNDLLREKDFHLLVEKFKYLSQFSYFRERCRDIYKLTINRLAIANQLSLIEQALETQKEYCVTEGFASRIIYLYGKHGMFDHAYKVFDEMPERKCPRGVKSFNVLLGAACNSGKYDKVMELFRELPEKLSIKPDVECYDTVMNALCKLGLVQDAVVLLDVMEVNGLKPDVVSYNTLMCVYYEDGDCEKGDKLWERMILNDMVPNVTSYNFKLRGLIKNGKLLEALELAMQLKDKGVKPDVCTYNAVIQGLIKDDDLDCAKEWYGKMVESGCAPNKITFNTFVPFLCEKGDYELAFEVSASMLKKRHASIDEGALQTVVNGLAKISKADKADELVKLGLSNSYAPYKLLVPECV